MERNGTYVDSELSQIFHSKLQNAVQLISFILRENGSFSRVTYLLQKSSARDLVHRHEFSILNEEVPCAIAFELRNTEADGFIDPSN